jgi:hypothetical protein
MNGAAFAAYLGVMRTRDMSDIPEWPDAERTFREFLRRHGHEGQVRWVFREDIYQPEPLRVLTCSERSMHNERLTAKVFAEGRRAGLVELSGLATTGSTVLATVWYPKRR